MHFVVETGKKKTVKVFTNSYGTFLPYELRKVFSKELSEAFSQEGGQPNREGARSSTNSL
jgi:hypothetical protein